MIRPARFRVLCSALGDVEARPHFDRTAFRTPARTFATLGPSGKEVNVLLPLETQQVLVDSLPEAFSRVNGAWGARGWTRMELAHVDEATCREVLLEAHALAAPRPKKRAAAKPAAPGKEGKGAAPKAKTRATAKPAAPTKKAAAPKAKARAKAAPSKKGAAPKVKARASATQARATRATEATVAEIDALEEILGPTIRAYAEEELRILKVAAGHPELGPRFVREMAKTNAAVPKKYRAAFREAMKGVDVAARARAIVKKMEEYWGTSLDAATKAEVRADVAAMYRGEGAGD